MRVYPSWESSSTRCAGGLFIFIKYIGESNSKSDPGHIPRAPAGSYWKRPHGLWYNHSAPHGAARCCRGSNLYRTKRS